MNIYFPKRQTIWQPVDREILQGIGGSHEHTLPTYCPSFISLTLSQGKRRTQRHAPGRSRERTFLTRCPSLISPEGKGQLIFISKIIQRKLLHGPEYISKIILQYQNQYFWPKKGHNFNVTNIRPQEVLQRKDFKKYLLR